jgi:hypothetical protein
MTGAVWNDILKKIQYLDFLDVTMTANQILEFMNRSPFEPIEIHLADGKSIRVESPHEIATKPNAAVCIVFDGDVARFVSLRNITEVITTPLGN